jgi:hypothetical protein
MNENIKKTAITAAGYIYQNLQGLSVLCDWLDAPTRYRRVKFECDNENEAPQALDDIVIERSDGLVDLQQIKFTPDADKHPLSWDWMLENTGKTDRSRSMLRKWFDAYNKLEPARTGDILLITNRRPDAAIEACLAGDKIDPSRIQEPQRTRVVAELGSLEACTLFFSQLRIRHSDKGYVALEHDIESRFRQHGTPEGIANLKYVALTWATQKNLPAPEGWITLPDVLTILRALPPAPLSEDFVVPEGYEVPNAAFHDEFSGDVINATGKAVVLTGPPGRGKSTYLSALCNELIQREIPTVRHHYFLSTTERGRDRVNSYVVEQSVRAQVENFHRDVPRSFGGLRELLTGCAAHYKAHGKPFVLVLDGLDHVWRVNAEDKRPLDDVFSQIIPCPENMVLIVGTQPVNDAQLPSDLLALVPKSKWYTLPAMSESAVFSYLLKAVEEGWFTTGPGSEADAESQLQEAASALRQRTNGHPLHVIYATSELKLAGRRITRWDIEQLRGDLSQDARFYYASLWERLAPGQKDTLRLICALPFFWPRMAFLQIADIIHAAQPDVDKVEHLLHSSPAGLKVFHESLAVFVRTTDSYEERISELLPTVAEWLEHQAPTSLRVNWLWTVQAKLGNPRNLIKGLTRDWVIDRLTEGYPESLFETLLSDALIAALDTAQFADANRLGHLKARMVGGSQFQMQDSDLAWLVSFSLALSSEDSVILESVASRHETDFLHVAALGLALLYRGDAIHAKICGREAFHQFCSLTQFSSRYNSGGGSNELSFLARAFIQFGVMGSSPEDLVWLIDNNDAAIWLPRVQMLVQEGHLDDLMTVVTSLSDGPDKNIISDACIRAGALAGVTLTDREDADELVRTPFVAAVEVAVTRTSTPSNEPIPVNWLSGSYDKRKEHLANLVHNWFFGAIHLQLCMLAEGQTHVEAVPAPFYEDRENITDYLDALSGIGMQLAQRWWRGEFIHFHEIYELLSPVDILRFRQSYNRTSATTDFQAALHRIACDIQTVSVMLTGQNEVRLSPQTMKAASQCAWFDSASFRVQYTSGSLTRMADEAALAFICAQRLLLDEDVQSETSVHLQIPLQLCAMAVSHRLTSEARELRTQTWELTTGYGHRKDPTLGNALDGIAYLIDAVPGEACRLLAQLAPQVHRVLDYTDGKGTRHVLTAADRLLASLKPSALVIKLEEHTCAGHWPLAENSLQAYIEQGVTEGWPLDALMRTGLHPEVRDTLQQRADDGFTRASGPLSILNEHNGWGVGCVERNEYSAQSTDDKPFTGDVTLFGPDQLADLLNHLEPHYHDRPALLLSWYQHWEGKKQGRVLLTELDKVLFSKTTLMSGVLHLCEPAFHTKRRSGGLKAAWKYLVQAQIRSGGWVGYMENAEVTRHRLDLVAQYYPERCDEFVAATTYSMFDDPVPSRIVPTELMVYFYIKQNRTEEAVTFAQTMVHCVLEDTRTLSLKAPRWMSELLAPVSPEVR